MSKHTPGPWDWRDGDDLRQAKSTRDDGRYGAQVIGAGYDYDRGAYLDMTDADRDLIAAAPEMLAALRRLFKACGHMPIEATPESAEMMVAGLDAVRAIKKATGEDP